MTSRERILQALRDTRRLDGTLDTHQITLHLIHNNMIMGDDESWGESRVIDALDSEALDATDAELATAIAVHLGITEEAAA